MCLTVLVPLNCGTTLVKSAGFFVLCVFPLDLSGTTGRTGKIDNKREVIGAQVEYKNLKRNKLLMLSCNS